MINMIKTKYGNAIENGAGHLVISNGEYRQKDYID